MKAKRFIALLLSATLAFGMTVSVLGETTNEENPIVIKVETAENNTNNTAEETPGAAQTVDSAQAAVDTANTDAQNNGDLDAINAAASDAQITAGEIETGNNSKDVLDNSLEKGAEYLDGIYNVSKDAETGETIATGSLVDAKQAMLEALGLKDESDLAKAIADGFVIAITVDAVDENGNPVFETDELGQILVDPETGNPIVKKELRYVAFDESADATESAANKAIDYAKTANTTDMASEAEWTKTRAEQNLKAAKEELVKAGVEVGLADERYNEALGKYEDALEKFNEAQAKVEEAEQKLSDAKEKSADALTELETAKKAAEALKDAADAAYAAIEAESMNEIKKQNDIIAELIKKNTAEDGTFTADDEYKAAAEELSKKMIQYYILEQYKDSVEFGKDFVSDTTVIDFKVETDDENNEIHYYKLADGTLVNVNDYDEETMGEVKSDEHGRLVYKKYVDIEGNIQIAANDILDKNGKLCMVVKYKDADGNDKTRYFSYDFDEKGSIVVFERNYSLEDDESKNIDEVTAVAYFEGVEAVTEIKDWFVNGVLDEGKGIQDIIDENGGEEPEWILSHKDNGEVVDYVTPDWDSKNSETNDFPANSGNVTYTSLENKNETKTYEFEGIKAFNEEWDDNGTKVSDVNNNAGSSSTAQKHLEEVRDKYCDCVDGKYVLKAGYKVEVTKTYTSWEPTWSDPFNTEEHTKTYTLDSTIEANNWFAQLFSDIKDWFQGANYNVQVAHTERDEEVVLEKTYQDVLKTTNENKGSATVESGSGNNNHSFSSNNAAESAANKAVESAIKSKVEAIGGMTYDEGTREYTKVVEEAGKKTTYTYTFSSNIRSEPHYKNWIYQILDDPDYYIYYYSVSMATEVKTEEVENKLVATAKYNKVTYNYAEREGVEAQESVTAVIGNDAKTGAKKVVWTDASDNDLVNNDEYAEKLADYEERLANFYQYKTKYETARSAVETARQKVEDLKEEIEELENVNIGSIKSDNEKEVTSEELNELKKQLEDAEEALDEAKDREEELKELVEKAEKIVKSIDLSRFPTPQHNDDDTEDGSFIADEEIPFEFPAAGAALTGVAGVRRNLVADAGEAEGEEIVADTEGTKIEEPTVIEEEELPAAKEPAKETTIEDEEVPAAKAPEKAGFPWWILIVLAACALGYGGYKYYDKKKNEDKVA